MTCKVFAAAVLVAVGKDTFGNTFTCELVKIASVSSFTNPLNTKSLADQGVAGFSSP